MSGGADGGGEPGGERERPVVLIVDDDDDLVDTCAYWLRNEGYEVRTAYNGNEALEVVDATVDVVLLDRRMPAVSGDEVLDRIRERGFECKVAMMTAVEPDSDLVEMAFDDYLVKPVSRTKIRETVDELLARTAFDEDLQEYFALDATESTLAERDPEDLEAPDELERLRAEIERLRADRGDISRRRAELDRLTRLNGVIREVDAAIVEASTREELEEAVCEAVVGGEPYLAACLVEYAPGVDAVRLHAAAGPTLDEATLSDASDLVKEAIEERGARVESPVSPTQYRAVCGEGGPDRGDVWALAVALRYRDTVYGALLVYAATPTGPGDGELEVFAELGESVANGINALESRRLLFADTVVELVFDHADPEDPLVALGGRAPGGLVLEGFAPGADGSLSCYVTLPGADAEAVLAYASDHPAFGSARAVSTGRDPLFEVSVEEGSILHALTDVGAAVDEFELNGDGARVVVTVAPEADLAAITDAVAGRFPGTEVVAKREVDRPVRSTRSFREDLASRLTDRQRAVLEAARSAGYFEWPRASTAEEVAESLGITPPTLHEHLRAAERKLTEAFFEAMEGERG